MNFFCQTFAYSKIMRTFATHLRNKSTGEMAEWSIAAVLKTVELRGSGGSNPSLSAINLENQGFTQNVHENVHETSEF